MCRHSQPRLKQCVVTIARRPVCGSLFARAHPGGRIFGSRRQGARSDLRTRAFWRVIGIANRRRSLFALPRRPENKPPRAGRGRSIASRVKRVPLFFAFQVLFGSDWIYFFLFTQSHFLGPAGELCAQGLQIGGLARSCECRPFQKCAGRQGKTRKHRAPFHLPCFPSLSLLAFRSLVGRDMKPWLMNRKQ